MSQNWAVKQGEIALGDCTLREDLVGFIALGQRWCTRTGQRMDFTGVERGLLHLAPCMTEVLLKLTLREAVFLMLLWPVGLQALLCG